ncbi:MAG: ABC transporter ATP-binding protein [Actinomycetia bacterium]|nr:ABC transporter ATP-binding protein [Actinomycetes bacterium]
MLAIDGLSLELGQGEVLAVIGPSGSGKSTLLRAIAGLELLAGGQISAGGRSLDGVPTNRRDLGLMFQDHALFPHLDVAGNVGFGLRMQGHSEAERRDRVGELLGFVGLAGFERRAVHELSGGEAQRVALARALAPEPALLMLDEPFGSLDRLLREELTAEVRGLLVGLGQAALHVTHDQVEAFALADRVAVLSGGRLAQIGRPEELWREPGSVFVAEFLGHPNIWPAVVGEGGAVRVGDQLVVEHSDLEGGECRLVVPIGAISLVEGGGFEGAGCRLGVMVTSVVFGEGRFRVTGTLVGAVPVPVVFDSVETVLVGDVEAVTVSPDGLHPIDIDGD